MHVLNANNYECINVATAYAANNSATALNSLFAQVSPAVLSLVHSHIPPPTTTATPTTTAAGNTTTVFF